MKKIAYIILIIGLLSSCVDPKTEKEKNQSPVIKNPTNKVVLNSEIIWEKLNPARGDQSPQAGTIWGDRKGEEATGFLAKFVDGFSSPPHIHNVTYRAIVIKGLIHNDDPNAENMWMKPGAFWTQPVGGAHITSAKGAECIALVEINKGPYLVQPIEQAFDSEERPINIDVSNIVWLNNKKTHWVGLKSEAEISFLLEKDGFKSLFVRLPKRYTGHIETDGTVVHAVVIQGELKYTMPQNNEIKFLDSGSYFGSTAQAIHTVATTSENEVIVYIRTNGAISVQ